MIIKIRLLFCLVTVLTVCSCTSIYLPHGKKGKLQGMVYDYENAPICGYIVSISNKYQTITDINGRFTFPVVAFGTIPISGESSMYASTEHMYSFYNPSQILYLKVPSVESVYMDIDDTLTKKNISRARKLLSQLPSEQHSKISYTIYESIISFFESDTKIDDAYISSFTELQRKLENELF